MCSAILPCPSVDGPLVYREHVSVLLRRNRPSSDGPDLSDYDLFSFPSARGATADLFAFAIVLTSSLPGESGTRPQSTFVFFLRFPNKRPFVIPKAKIPRPGLAAFSSLNWALSTNHRCHGRAFRTSYHVFTLSPSFLILTSSVFCF